MAKLFASEISDASARTRSNLRRLAMSRTSRRTLYRDVRVCQICGYGDIQRILIGRAWRPGTRPRPGTPANRKTRPASARGHFPNAGHLHYSRHLSGCVRHNRRRGNGALERAPAWSMRMPPCERSSIPESRFHRKAAPATARARLCGAAPARRDKAGQVRTTLERHCDASGWISSRRTSCPTPAGRRRCGASMPCCTWRHRSRWQPGIPTGAAAGDRRHPAVLRLLGRGCRLVLTSSTAADNPVRRLAAAVHGEGLDLSRSRHHRLYPLKTLAEQAAREFVRSGRGLAFATSLVVPVPCSTDVRASAEIVS